ncbi:unnamed protein product [Diplocarpon coronariae]|nr:cytosolic thioredoxin Trx1 [Diplocarpon mali]
MRVSSGLIGAFLAASGLAIVLPRPDIRIHISLPEGGAPGDGEKLRVHIDGESLLPVCPLANVDANGRCCAPDFTLRCVPQHMSGDEEAYSQQRLGEIASATSKSTAGNSVLDDVIHRLVGGDRVRFPSSNSEFDTFFGTPGKLVVVMFTAGWCGPCRFIAPSFADYSNRYADVVFVSVDIDKLGTLPQGSDIHSVPTFKFYRDQNLVSMFSGASQQKLQETIEANM